MNNDLYEISYYYIRNNQRFEVKPSEIVNLDIANRKKNRWENEDPQENTIYEATIRQYIPSDKKE